MRMQRDRLDGSLFWLCWYFVAGMVGFVIVSGDGDIFFHAMELQSPAMGNYAGGGKAHKVAFFVGR